MQMKVRGTAEAEDVLDAHRRAPSDLQLLEVQLHREDARRMSGIRAERQRESVWIPRSDAAARGAHVDDVDRRARHRRGP